MNQLAGVGITGFGRHQSVTEWLTAWCSKAIVACLFILNKLYLYMANVFLFVFVPFSLFDMFVCLLTCLFVCFDLFVQ